MICDKTIKTYLNFMRKILTYYETRKIFTINEFTRENVNEAVTALSAVFPRSMGTAVIALKSFLLFAKEKGIAVRGLSASLPRQVSSRKPIREGFTTDELNRILASVDLAATYGKRDYAMLLLAVQTGLRGVDIVNLKFSGVCWGSMEIRIVQHKTRKPLVLPMSVEAGNAISEYILNSRPKSDSEYIFLRCINPYTKLANGTATDIAQRYMQAADITNSNTPLRGFHSIRRSLGARMLDSEIPLQMISEVLGHTSPDSTKPYIAVHEEGLSRCSLDLSGLEIMEGVLK